MNRHNDADLIDGIYEAAILPDGWIDVINGISDRFGARGGLLFAIPQADSRYMAAGEAKQAIADFIAQGWAEHNDRAPRLIQKRYPGFLTDLDFYTPEEIAAKPMYQEFLIPRGYCCAAATAIQGATGETLILSIEGFAGGDEARRAVPYLDSLRPHLARSAMLASQIHLERARAATAAMQMIGVPAAFVNTAGRLRCANSLFEVLIGQEIFDAKGGLRLADQRADHRLRTALESARAGLPIGMSVPLKPLAGRTAAVLHAIPVTGKAREIFLDGGVVLILTFAGKTKQPGTEVLQALFDLTPAEAKLARALAVGAAPDDVARQFGVSITTVRSQLKSLFIKMGVNRQAQLVALLAGLMLPG